MALTRLMSFAPAIILAYLIASTNNWCLNRIWTFGRNCQNRHTAKIQWLYFVLANIPGLLVNRGLVFGLIWFFPPLMHILYLPLLAGAICGMLLNFFLSRHCVFHAHDNV